MTTIPRPYRVKIDLLSLAEGYLSPTIGVGREGYISGVIYEQISEPKPLKLPVQRRVLLYHQASGVLVKQTLSKMDGTYLFKHLALETDFMLVAIDHTKKWGLEGSAYRQPKRSVFDGFTVQYPRT